MPEEDEQIGLRELNNDNAPEPAPAEGNRLFHRLRRGFQKRKNTIYSAIVAIALGIMIGIMIYHHFAYMYRCKVESCQRKWGFFENMAPRRFDSMHPIRKASRGEDSGSKAEPIVEAVNRSNYPCENFYDFVCRNVKTNYSSLFYNTKPLVTLIDKINDESPAYLKKLKRIRDSCVEYQLNATEIKEKLEKIYEWPILNKDKERSEEDYDWMEVIHKLFKLGLTADYFMFASFQVDKRNNTKRFLRLDPPHFGMMRESFLESDDSPTVQEYKEAMLKGLLDMGATGNITKEVDEIYNLEKELAKISAPMLYDTLSIRHLGMTYANVKWLDYINGFLEPYAKIDQDELISIAVPFIDKFHSFMSEKRPPKRVLINYALWRAAYSIDFTDLLLFHYELPKEDKKSYCTTIVYNYLPLAGSALYLKNNDLDSAITAVKNMSLKLRSTFQQMVQKVGWLHKNMKDKIAKKISNIDLLIGYPIELRNDTNLEEFYKHLEISSDNYLTNLLNARKFAFRKEFETMKSFNKTSWTGHFGQILGLNTKYILQNGIHIPAGLIESHFTAYNYVNYAVLGFIMSRELALSLSVDAQYYNENGNFVFEWWDSRSYEQYKKKTDCVVKKYNTYKYPEFNFTVDGASTLDGNLGDINGLKIAYDTYLDYLKHNSNETKLVGFEAYSHKQLFWIFYASTLCKDPETLESLSKPEYTPERYRVIGAITSMVEFADDFNCKLTDDMNPAERCPIWF